MFNVSKFLLVEKAKTETAGTKYTLKRALKKGGTALVCVLTECPNCNSNIWIETGQHTGDGGCGEGIVKDICYKCCENYVINTKLMKIKDTAFLSIEEFTKFTYKNFIMNYDFSKFRK